MVPADVAYGMARMFEMLPEAKGEQGIRVFRTLEAGLRWIFLGRLQSEGEEGFVAARRD